jgi:hypothetical protein
METTMKKLLTIIAALAFSIAAFAQIPQDVIQTAHATALHTGEITFEDGVDECSATAVGPHAILTASHCESATDTLHIDGYTEGRIQIDRIIRDDADHSIYLLSGITFEHYTAVYLDYKPVVGEQVFFFGNPGVWSDLYREGYVAGHTERDNVDTLLVNVNGWHGDSGAGLFTVSGKLIGVISGRATQNGEDKGDVISLGAVYALAFSPAELVEASRYGTEDAPAKGAKK